MTVALDGWTQPTTHEKIINFVCLDGSGAYFWSSVQTEDTPNTGEYLKNKTVECIEEIEAKGGIVIAVCGDNVGKYKRRYE